jgi:hypothetical protein
MGAACVVLLLCSPGYGPGDGLPTPLLTRHPATQTEDFFWGWLVRSVTSAISACFLTATIPFWAAPIDLYPWLAAMISPLGALRWKPYSV